MDSSRLVPEKLSISPPKTTKIPVVISGGDYLIKLTELKAKKTRLKRENK